LRNFREIFFRVIGLACVLMFLAFGGITSILAPWGSAGGAFPGFTPELHRWHSALLGVTEAIFLPGLLLALIRRPRERPLLMQFFGLVGVALVLPHLLTRGSTPLSSLFIALPVIAFPALGALMRFSHGRRTSKLLLALALLTAALLIPDALRNLQMQLAGAGGEHARQGHWATAFSLNLVITLAALLASMRLPGSQALGLLLSIALLYLGSAAITLPDHAGSWGATGGGFSLLIGSWLVIAIWREGRYAKLRNLAPDDQGR
jgi:hypothetical protein